MISALLSKLSLPALVMVIGVVGGIGLQQKVLSRKEVVKVDYDKVRTIVAEEVSKLPKPQPAQSLDIDKIKGKVGKVEIHQHYDIVYNGDSLLTEKITEAVRLELNKLKISKCK